MTRSCVAAAMALALAGLAESSPAAAPATGPIGGPPVFWQPFLNATPAQGTGKWRPYEVGLARAMGGDATSMWFCSGGFIWRYDVKSRQIHSFSALDGLPIAGYVPAAFVADGRGGCAAMYGSSVFRWTEADGWRALPAPDGQGQQKAIAVDGRGQLLMMVAARDKKDERATTIWRWQDEQWRLVVHSKEIAATGFCPAGDDQFLVSDYFGYREVRLLGKDGKLARDKDGNLRELWRPENGMGYCVSGYLPVGDRVLCTANRNRVDWFEYAKGQDKLRPLDANTVGVDLAGSGYVRRLTGDDKKIRFATDDGAVVEFPYDELVLRQALMLTGMVFRDANKDFWVSDRRWDGKEWKHIAPDGQMSQVPWGTNQPRIICQDVMDRHAWLAPRYGSRMGNGLELLKITDWQISVVTSIKPTLGSGVFLADMVDPTGRRWGYVMGQKDGGNYFPVPFYMRPDGTIQKLEGDFTPARISPAGEVWFKGDSFLAGSTKAARFDEASGELHVEPDEAAMEALAIRAGGMTITLSLDTLNGCLREKVGDRWQPMRNPLKRPTLGSLSMICGGRMLVSINANGTWEFDMAGKRWIQLTNSFLPGYFDSKGRRVVNGLIFDGDPFETEKGLKDVTAEDRELFADLLKRMDADDYKVRESATEELKKNVTRLASLIWQSVGREDLSMEAHTRLRTVTDELLALREKGGFRPLDLFRRMHPPLRPPAAATRPATRPATAPATGPA